MWVKARDGRAYNLKDATSIECSPQPESENKWWVCASVPGAKLGRITLVMDLTQEEAETQFAAILKHLDGLILPVESVKAKVF